MSTMAKCVNLLGQLMHNLRAFIINRSALRADYILPSLEISLGIWHSTCILLFREHNVFPQIWLMTF